MHAGRLGSESNVRTDSKPREDGRVSILRRLGKGLRPCYRALGHRGKVVSGNRCAEQAGESAAKLPGGIWMLIQQLARTKGIGRPLLSLRTGPHA